MSEINKKIKFSADNTELNSSFNQVETKVKGMFGEMIRNARDYSSSSKDVVKSIEDQIKALEKRNKLASEVQLIGATAEFAAGNYPKKRFEEFKGDIARDKSESKQMVALLKDLLSTTKDNAKKELYADRRNVESQIRHDEKSLSHLGIKRGNEVRSLKSTIQRGELAGMQENEFVEGGGWRGKYNNGFGKAGKAFNTGAGMLATGADVYMAAAMVSMLPVIGHGMSTLMSKSIGEADKLEKSMGSFYRLSGTGSPKHWKSQGTDFGHLFSGDDDKIDHSFADNYDQNDYDNAVKTMASSKKGSPAWIAAGNRRNAAASRMKAWAKSDKKANSKSYSGITGALSSISDVAGAAVNFGGGLIDSFTSGIAEAGHSEHLTKFGLQRDDVLNKAVSLAPHLGHASKKAGLEALMLEKAFGMQSTGGLAAMTHAGAGSMTEQTNIVVKSLQAAGILQSGKGAGGLGDTTLLNKTVEAMLSFSQGQIAYSKHASGAGAGALMSHFQGKHYTTEAAATLTRGMQTGMGGAGNSQNRALQLSALSRANPGKSYTELVAMLGTIQTGNMDAIFEGGYGDNYLGMIESASPNKDMLAMNLNQAMFGGDEKTLQMVMNSVDDGSYKDLSGLQAKVKQQKGLQKGNITGRADQSTGNIEASQAKYNEGFADGGRGIISATKDLTTAIEKILAKWDHSGDLKGTH